MGTRMAITPPDSRILTHDVPYEETALMALRGRCAMYTTYLNGIAVRGVPVEATSDLASIPAPSA